MKLATSAQMRELDQLAINKEGIPSSALMMSAAAHIVQTAKEVMGENRRAAIYCGSGHNGGDGIAAAVLLAKEGYELRVFLVGGRDKMAEDTREMERRLGELDCKMETFDPELREAETWAAAGGVVIDAIFGMGLNAPLRGKPLAAVEQINRLNVPVVSADIATGIAADTGKILGTAVRAAHTVTFTLPKVGNFVGDGLLHAGCVKVVDIGIPQNLINRIKCQNYLIAKDSVSLPARRQNMHKGDAGKLLLIGGSVGYTGALVLAANAALRSGAGLVFLGVPESIYAITAANTTEAMAFPLPATEGKLNMQAFPALLERMNHCDAVLIGPGMGRSAETTQLVTELIRAAQVPVIIDADGLNAVSEHIHILDEASAPLILTPHDAEFARLVGDQSSDSRLEAARTFAIRRGCTVVLKGPGTISAFPEGTVCVNTTGNPGMATGGSGDVLAGMITAFAGQGLPLPQAVYTAVWAHGRAGDLAAAELGQYSMLPSDVVELLPEVLKKIVR